MIDNSIVRVRKNIRRDFIIISGAYYPNGTPINLTLLGKLDT